MSASDVAAGILLAIVVVSAWFSVIGVLLAANFYERLHYMSVVACVGLPALVAAMLVKESVNQAGIKTILIGLILFFANAVQTHVTARAGRIEQQGSLGVRPDEERSRVQSQDSRRGAA